MNNSDMPAMPLSGDAYNDFAHYDGTKNTSYNPQCQGLTKREYIKAHAPAMPQWFGGDYKAWLNFHADCVLGED